MHILRTKRKLFLTLLVAIAILSSNIIEGATPYPWHERSWMPTVIRTTEANLETLTYTFKCDIPPEANPLRSWTIHTSEWKYLLQEQSSNDTVTITLSENEMWHITCGVFDFDGEYVYSDFHIDLRTELYTDRPNLEWITTNNTSYVAECTHPTSDNVNTYWTLFYPRTGETFDLPEFNNMRIINSSVPEPGLWSFSCGTWDYVDNEWSSSGWDIEFFEEGQAYIPSRNGCVPGEGCPIFLGNHTNETEVPREPPIVSPEDPIVTDNTSDNFCPTIITDYNATCERGMIVQDTYNGCRTILCMNQLGSMQVLACDKPDSKKPTYFEIYRQSYNADVEICIGETCIRGTPSSRGFIKSTEYDNECDLNITEPVNPPVNNTTNTTNTTTPTPPSNSYCVSSTENIPATCNGAQITQDIYDGCRYIVCGLGDNSLNVLACDKPNSHNASYFEMYKQSPNPNNYELCLGDTCISNRGFVRSADYPYCTEQVIENNNLIPLPIFSMPTEGTLDVEPYHFNLNVFPMEGDYANIWNGITFEMYEYDSNELIWVADNTDNRHPRNGDGIFVGSMSGLDTLKYDTWYKVRARHHIDNATNNIGDWSNFISFKTRDQFIGEESNWTWTAKEGYKIELVASNINLPVTLEPAPLIYNYLPSEKRPKLYMTHLYGQIGVLLFDGTYVEYASELLNYEEFGSLPGSGEIGVIGLYADNLTGDLFVSMSYWDSNESKLKGKIDRFITDINGTGYTNTTTIIDDIPVSPAHQVQEITRGPDGKLYVGTGDADMPYASSQWNALHGKILRMNDDGSELEIVAAGLRNPYGHTWNPFTNELFVGNNGEDSNDGIYKVLGGETFGWCTTSCNTIIGTFHYWPQTVVPTSLTFNDGNSIFPDETMGDLFIVHVGPAYVPGQLERGKRIKHLVINETGVVSETDLVRYTGKGYGTPLGLTFLEDGLYFSDMFGEKGFTGYANTEGNIYRIVPGVQTKDAAPENDKLSVSFGPARWYPQGTHMVWECRGNGGSENYSYSYYYGDGASQINVLATDRYHIYPSAGTYQARCVVTDVESGETAEAITSITLSV